jgi:hypothetical protein
VKSSPRVGVVVLALVFLAFHVPYLPQSLEDLDSINFALGVRSFDVAHHQPHPPGYPVFIAMAKGVHRVTRSEPRALSALSVMAGTLGVLVLFELFGRLALWRNSPTRYDRPDASGWPLLAALIATTSPLYWFTAARPLSDTTGLVDAIGIQALTLAASSDAGIVLASFAAAVGAGIRSQVLVLTAPLLLLAIVRRRDTNPVRLTARCLLAGLAGGLVWGVPLVVASGGPTAYWRALFSQGAEDFSGIQMLWTTPTARELISALSFGFVAPWARWEAAAVVLALASLGVARMFRRAPDALLALGVAFVPYFVFDALFQETFTTRYALPLVVPIAYLAAQGAALLGPRHGVVLAIVVAVVDAHIAGTSVAAYARQPAPAFRLLRDMRFAVRSRAGAPVLAADRRDDLDLRRPITWVGEAMPPLAGRLPAPPKHEWLEAVKYWNGGGRAPVWFVVDPKRAQMALVDHSDPIQYRWPLPYPVLLGGVRPNEMDWYRVDRPEWYVGEGWALTPEAAGTATEDRRGPGFAPIEAWIRRRTEPVTMMIGGRNLGSSPSSRVMLTVDGERRDEWTAAPGFFLRTMKLAPAVASGADYVGVTVAADPSVAIEQFDVGPPGRVVFGFDAGWQEQEYDSTTGLRWRWLSERGQLRVRGIGRPLALHIEGESPRKYYSRPSRFLVHVGDRVLLDETLGADFSLTATIPPTADPADEQVITLETDQVFSPADRSRRSADRRRLGLRIFSVRIVPAS